MIFRKKYTLETDLSLEKARKRMINTTIHGSPLISGIWSGINKDFKGQIFKDSFHIRRVLLFNNSFEPVIDGRFSYHATGLRLNLKFKLHRFTLALLILTYNGFIFFILPISFVLQEIMVKPWIIISFLIGFLLLGVFLFNIGSKKSKNELMEILDTREI